MIGVLLFLYQAIVNVVKCNNVAFLQNVDCAPYVDYIGTDVLNYFRYNPFYIRLFRCHGADSLVNPRNRHCIPTSTGIEDRDIYVYNMANKEWKTISVKNHTECEESCSLEESMCSPYQRFLKDECACSCKHEKTPSPNPCAVPFYWDRSMCDCICSLETKMCVKRKEFSKDECACVCKQKFHVRCAKRKKAVDEETCECIESTFVSTGESTGDACKGNIITLWGLIVVMVMEVIFILILYFFVYRYCYKRVYFKLKADKKAESITNYPSHDRKSENGTITYQGQGYSVDNVAHSRSTMGFDEEVPPYTLNKNSLNRNSLNRNSLNRNSLNRNSLNRGNGINGNSLPRPGNNNNNNNNTSIFHTKPNIESEDDSENFYSKDERSPLSVPYDESVLYNDTEADVYNDIEPIVRDYDSEISACENYKSISLV